MTFTDPKIHARTSSSSSPALREKLRRVERELADLRSQRAATQSKVDAAKAALGHMEGKLNTSSPEFSAATEAKRELDELDTQIAEAQDTQVGLLKILGEGTATGRNSAGDLVGDPTTVAALKQPGSWLSSVLDKRKHDAPSRIPEDYRLMSAPGVLTSEHISTQVEGQVLIDLLAPISVATASGILTYPIDTTKTRLPRFTELPEAAWVPEGGAFPKQAPGIEMVEVKPPKVGLVSPLSVEVFEDLSPVALAMLQTQILRAIALAYDHGIMFGDGEDDSPLGVANTPGITTVEAHLDGLKPFTEAIAKLLGSNAFPGALVMNPLDLAELFEQTEWESEDGASKVPLWKAAIQRAANGAFALQLPYFGTPVWPTPACPEGESLLYDPSNVVAVVRREADIAVDPFYGFDTGEVGFRCYLRGDVVVGQPKGAVHINLLPAASATP